MAANQHHQLAARLRLVKSAQYRLSREYWVAAGVIAWLRMWVNDPIRASHRSRGPELNFLNDLQGAAGELLALRRAESVPGFRSDPGDLVDFGGPVDRVDLELHGVDTDEVIGLEAKCLLWERRKRLFLINKMAHERSLSRDSVGYIPSISVVGGSAAVVGRLLTAHEVESWPVHEFQYADPALGVQLSECSGDFFGQVWQHTQKYISAELCIEPDALADLSREVAEQWRTSPASVSALKVAGTVGEVVATLARAPACH